MKICLLPPQADDGPYRHCLAAGPCHEAFVAKMGVCGSNTQGKSCGIFFNVVSSLRVFRECDEWVVWDAC